MPDNSGEAQIGYGATLAYDDAAGSGSFTTLAEMMNPSGPNISADAVETTHQNSASGFREFIPGLVDGGEVTLECNYLPDEVTQGGVSGVWYIMKNRQRRNWKMVFPGSPEHSVTFAGVVTAFEPDVPVDDRMTLSITLKVSGVPTFA